MFQLAVAGSTGPEGIAGAAGVGFLAAIVVIVTAVATTLLVLWGLRVVRRLDEHSQHTVDDALTQLGQATDETAPHSHSLPASGELPRARQGPGMGPGRIGRREPGPVVGNGNPTC